MGKDLYETLQEVDALIANTYVWAVLIAIITMAITYLVARLIPWKGGLKENSHIVRRIWYILIGLVATFSFFLYNTLIVSDNITKAPLVAKFSTANIFATVTLLLIYIAIGIFTMLIFRRSKWGSILGIRK